MPRVTNPPGARIATGTYTGDGSTSKPVTGVGFAPKYLRIWVDVGLAENIVEIFEKTDQHPTQYATRYIGAVTATQFAQLDNRLISLDSDGFTVDDDGADAHPNKNLQGYIYVCIG